MMRMTTIFAAGAAFGLALSAVALVRPAQAADDEVTVDQKFMRGIMEGLGLKRDGEEMINYRERSPLVIPPSRALPPPERVMRRLPTILRGRKIPTRTAQGAGGHGKGPQRQ